MRSSMGVLVVSVAWALGCGGSSSGGGKTLDCAYLGGDNCWKTTAASAASCLPPESETGTLSADGKTCTYASGTVVTFTPALVLPLPANGNQTWNFTVTAAGGAMCLSYKDDGNGGITLNVQGQTVKEGATGSLGVSLTCPDGTTYSNANAFALFSCPDAGLLGGLPGAAWSDTSTSVSLSLLATSSSGSFDGQPVFNCQKAP
ncbi:MAG TPA: hypothetical protein VHM31_14350 [Polyangia bacterium]|nr:hypothetical protein [Polyangia bacterium]